MLLLFRMWERSIQSILAPKYRAAKTQLVTSTTDEPDERVDDKMKKRLSEKNSGINSAQPTTNEEHSNIPLYNKVRGNSLLGDARRNHGLRQHYRLRTTQNSSQTTRRSQHADGS